jgi:hypothetical protein
LLNAEINRLVNRPPYGDFKLEFIPLLSNVGKQFAADNASLTVHPGADEQPIDLKVPAHPRQRTVIAYTMGASAF